MIIIQSSEFGIVIATLNLFQGKQSLIRIFYLSP